MDDRTDQQLQTIRLSDLLSIKKFYDVTPALTSIR